MKRHGNLDISGSLKLRGVAVDDFTTQGGFYSQQFGETAYKSDITPGFYGIYVRESDGNPPTFKNDTLIFDSKYFYLHADSIGKPSISYREVQVDHGSLAGLADDDHTQYIRVDGTRAFTGVQSHGNNRITNLGAPTDTTDAARLQDVITARDTAMFYSKLVNLEDVTITAPQIFDFLQFYSTAERSSGAIINRWVNRPFIQFKPIITESQLNAADPGESWQKDNVTLFAVNEVGAVGTPKLWVKSSPSTVIGAEPANDPAYDLSRDNVTSVINNSGSTITRGQILYFTATGVSANNPRVSLANSSSNTTMPAVGVVFTTTVEANLTFTMLVRGIMGGLDTSAMSQGALVYVSETTSGAFTSTAPVGLNSIRQPIGICVRANATTGRIFFNFSVVSDVNTISDGTNSHIGYDLGNLGVNNTQFYLSRNTGRTVINLNTYAQNFNLSGEWQATHNFNSTDIIFNTYDNRNIAITPHKADMSNPNTAFFYFHPTPRSGRALLMRV